MKNLIAKVRNAAAKLVELLTPQPQPEPVRLYIPVESEHHYIRRTR